MTSTQEQHAQKAIQRLDDVIRSRGWGAIRASEAAIGKSSSWWHGPLEKGDLRLSDFLALLEHLGLDEGDFLRQALDKEGVPALHRPVGEEPLLVARVRERLEHKPRQESDRQPSDRQPSDRQPSGRQESEFGLSFLESLDKLRYEDAELASTQALWAVNFVPPELLPRLLGIGGSTDRLRIRLRDAYHAIYFGLSLAREWGDFSATADLLQRLGYVVAHDGSYHRALRLAEDAAVLHLREADSAGAGKALVDQGIWLHYLGRTQEAIRGQESALTLLPEGGGRSRCAAYQHLAQFHYSLGRLEPASGLIEKAEALAGEVGPMAGAKITWLKALILAGQGDLAGADETLSQTISVLWKIDLGVTALATCDLVRLLLLRGLPRHALEAAGTMRPMIFHLRQRKVMAAAIAELLRCEREGLTLTLVDEVRTKIEAELRARGRPVRPSKK